MSNTCYICRQEQLSAEREVTGPGGVAFRVTCNACGTYEIAKILAAGDRSGTALSPEDRLRLRYAIRRETDQGGMFQTVLDTNVSEDVTAHIRLPSGLEQINLLLNHIAERTEVGQQTEEESWSRWAARLGLRDEQHFSMMIGLLQEFVQRPMHDGDRKRSALRLTYEGWKHADTLRRRPGRSNQAFVAMWFHPEVQGAFDKGIRPALEDTHHTPYRVDQGAHNNKIDDEIVAQIRRSRVVIVDMTGARPSVYFEAGFAMGLGIPVIWCCNSSWKTLKVDLCADSDQIERQAPCRWTDMLAFDTRQYNFIFWKDFEDLRIRLRDRIRALNLDPEWVDE